VGAVGRHPPAQLDETPPGLHGEADGQFGVGLRGGVGVGRFGDRVVQNGYASFSYVMRCGWTAVMPASCT